MQLSLTTLLIGLVLLIMLSAFFSGSEIGMMSLNRYRLRHLVKKNDRQAKRVNQMLQRPDKLLGVILIGNTFANIFASMIATLMGQRLYGDAGAAVATLLLTLVVLIFAEMTPKTLAAMYSQQMAFKVSWLLKLLQTMLAPFVQIITLATTGILRLFGITLAKSQREVLTNEELRSVVGEAESLLPNEHRNMLIGLLDLEQATVEDIMILKSDIIGLDIEQPWHVILDQLTTAQHTRLPLYRGDIDEIVGIVHVRDILNLALEEDLNLESLMAAVDEPYFIPEQTPLNLQILNFRKMKRRSCFVVNEYGELQGLVTLEDILEEVVGEFTTDMAAFSKDITIQEDKSVIVDASVTLRHLMRVLGWPFPQIGPRTLSGLIIEQLGYIPPANCCLKINDVQIEILMVSDNMVRTVRMRRVER